MMELPARRAPACAGARRHRGRSRCRRRCRRWSAVVVAVTTAGGGGEAGAVDGEEAEAGGEGACGVGEVPAGKLVLPPLSN